jgi:hypothetical protein
MQFTESQKKTTHGGYQEGGRPSKHRDIMRKTRESAGDRRGQIRGWNAGVPVLLNGLSTVSLIAERIKVGQKLCNQDERTGHKDLVKSRGKTGVDPG